MGIEVDIYVNPRVQERHPDMSSAMVQEAWSTTLRCIPRDTDPVQWVGGWNRGRQANRIYCHRK